MAAAKSTRLAITQHALEDTLERLEDMPSHADVRALRAKAMSYVRAIHGWAIQTPSPEQRAALMKCVLDLNVEVMALSRRLKAAVPAEKT